MSNFPKDRLFLKELLIPTLGSVDKLCSAWDGLNIETQLFIFSQIEGDFEDRYLPQRYPDYLLRKIQLKALESKNEFVRYKAAKALYKSYEPDKEEMLINKRIDNDPSDLVKYVSFEGSMADSESYFSEPKALRQARFRGYTFGMNSDYLASFILSLLDGDLINTKDREDELYYILSEYTQSSKFKEDFRKTREIDGYLEYSKGESLKDLWNLVPKLPISSAHILVTELPEKAGLSNFNIDFWRDKFTNNLLLDEFLWRKDIRLPDYRKEIFWKDKRPEDKDSYNHHEWLSACSSNFTIEDKDFDKLSTFPRDEKIERMKVLVEYASNISLEYLLIIKYTLKELENDDDAFDEYFNFSFEDNISNRIKIINKRERYNRDELIRFRLAYLAKKSLSWKSEEDVEADTYAGDDRLNFLYIKNPKNSWDAYQKISEKWLAGVKPLEQGLFNPLLAPVYPYEKDFVSLEQPDEEESVEGRSGRIERLAFRNDILNYLKLVIVLLVAVLIVK
jgi:hypothetical protein